MDVPEIYDALGSVQAPLRRLVACSKAAPVKALREKRTKLHGKYDYPKKGQCGYFCTDFDSPTSTLAIARQVVDMLNDRLGITEAQKLAMVAGSMAGFHVPAANPDHYTPKLH